MSEIRCRVACFLCSRRPVGAAMIVFLYHNKIFDCGTSSGQAVVMTIDDFREHSAPSRDGARIGWQQLGRGPALVVNHGGARAAKHYRELARCLASRFTVVLMDRRGRGAGGPAGPGVGRAHVWNP